MIYMISFVTIIEIDLDIHSSLSLGVRSGRRGHISPFVILHKRSNFTTGISFEGHGRQYGAGWL